MERFAVSTSRSFLRENSAITVELSSAPAYFALLYHGIIVDFVEYSMKNSTDVPDIRWDIPLNFYSATIGVYAKFSSSRNPSTYIYVSS